MNSTLHEKHRDNLTMYVNDVIGLERDIVNAVEGQLEDDKVKSNPQLTPILKEIVSGAKTRIDLLQQLSEAEGGSFGATVKEAVMGVTGALAGIYGKLREHPVSRMVRDDRIAMNVVETSYAMLYTLALGIGHEKAAAIALSGLNAAPPLVLELTDLMPGIILRELSEDAPLQNATVQKTVVDAIHNAWGGDPGSV
jgi:ferritin-like metal-binding protein YciE